MFDLADSKFKTQIFTENGGWRKPEGCLMVMMTICGGGSVAVLGYSGTGIPHKTGTIYSNGTINGYTWVNDSGATDTFTFAAIKTRNTG